MRVLLPLGMLIFLATLFGGVHGAGDCCKQLKISAPGTKVDFLSGIWKYVSQYDGRPAYKFHQYHLFYHKNRWIAERKLGLVNHETGGYELFGYLRFEGDTYCPEDVGQQWKHVFNTNMVETKISVSCNGIVDGTCYQDDGSRLLDKQFDNRKLTPEVCQQTCSSRGYLFAGVQFSYQCFCGNDKPPASRIRSIAQCNSNCPGDASQKCGGSWRMNIYNAKQKPDYVYGQKYPGGEARELPSGESCHSVCQKETNCKAWTWNGKDKECRLQLHTSIPQLEENDDSVSATRSTPKQKCYSEIGPYKENESEIVFCLTEKETGPLKYLTSPNYPNEYSNNQDTTQTMSVPDGYSILVKFLDFQIENHPDCGWDYVQVCDANGNCEEKMCGSSLPGEINIKTSTATVKFHSDGSVTRKGFKLSYEALTDCSEIEYKEANQFHKDDNILICHQEMITDCTKLLCEYIGYEHVLSMCSEEPRLYFLQSFQNVYTYSKRSAYADGRSMFSYTNTKGKGRLFKFMNYKY